MQDRFLVSLAVAFASGFATHSAVGEIFVRTQSYRDLSIDNGADPVTRTWSFLAIDSSQYRIDSVAFSMNYSGLSSIDVVNPPSSPSLFFTHGYQVHYFDNDFSSAFAFQFEQFPRQGKSTYSGQAIGGHYQGIDPLNFGQFYGTGNYDFNFSLNNFHNALSNGGIVTSQSTSGVDLDIKFEFYVEPVTAPSAAGLFAITAARTLRRRR